jgi:hypothetical protein
MSAIGDASTGRRKRLWPRRIAVSCLVIFGPALLIGVFGPWFDPDAHSDGDGDGLYLLFLANIAMTAVVVGVVLVIGYWLVRWLVVWQKSRLAERKGPESQFGE